MPRGADDRFWAEPGLPGVFKHTLLEQYVPQFAGMTASRSAARRVVFLDGLAGRGRYDDGRLASAELVLRIAQHQGGLCAPGRTRTCNLRIRIRSATRPVRLVLPGRIAAGRVGFMVRPVA